jgi:outer membrane lipopolysaccharide assembly protein LptE/RlpB
VIRVAAALLLSCLLAACGGWQLRGTGPNHLGVTKVTVVGEPGSYLYSWFITQLGYSGVTVVTDRTQAEAVIELRRERYDRRVLSVDADTGKVREMEVGLQIEMSVRGADGSLISAPQQVTWTQDFVFDEGSLLGTEEVETTIRYELAKDAARSLIFRLETIDFPPARKNAG